MGLISPFLGNSNGTRSGNESGEKERIMEVIGVSRGQVLLEAGFEEVFTYFSDQKKILSYNPLCKSVESTEYEDIYRWNFEVTDPQSHPIRLIFFVEQEEIMSRSAKSVEVNSESDNNPTDDIISGDIFWKNVPVELEGAMPDDRTFIGKAFGEMHLKKSEEEKTMVDVQMKVQINFAVPFLLKIFPEPILKIMSESAMSFAMQNVSNKMLENISKDFRYSVVAQQSSGKITEIERDLN